MDNGYEAVRNKPHWRVRFTASSYEEERISSLKECWRVVSSARVRFRGWPYPPVCETFEELILGDKWISYSVDWSRHREYWRFYQSTQFVHLFVPWEYEDEEWQAKLRDASARALNPGNWDLNETRCFLSRTNFIYTMTEIYEFAARLVEAGVYDSEFLISIQLVSFQGFLIVEGDFRVGFPRLMRTSVTPLKRDSWIDPRELMADPSAYSLGAIEWFFERSGGDVNKEEVARVQRDLREGRL